MNFSVGIIGGGVVGQAVKAFYPEAKVYDVNDKFDTLEEVLAQDLIFICVPTPYNKGFDLSVMDEVFSNFKDLPAQAGLAEKIIVIKSTVLPGTTDNYQKKFPNLKVFFNPEFLDNKTAAQDFAQPDKQLVGYTKGEDKELAQQILEFLPQAPYQKVMPAKEAEMVKYTVNTYYATKVVFANQIYDICQALDIDYNAVRQAFEADRRVAPGNFDVWHGGSRGFAGKCLPKDFDSLVDLADKLGVEVSLLKEVRRINEELLKQEDNKTR